jgi:hypothetical protein
MNREDIIRMGREALNQRVDYTVWTLSTPHLEEFARLVAAAEREACAKVCDELVLEHPGRADLTAKQCAAAIRARGQE